MWAFTLLLLVLSDAAAAQEQTCGALVDQLSEKLGLETQTAEAPPSRTDSLTETLKDSGGVIAPPDVGAPARIEPPATADRMPTAPPAAPRADDQSDPSAKAAARLAQIEALLTAARAAAAGGNEGECTARLAEAEQLAAADGDGGTNAVPR